METFVFLLVCFVAFELSNMAEGHEIFRSHCNGRRQSPIDIRTNSVNRRKISIHYTLQTASLRGHCRNDGHYFICEAEPGYRITGVPYNKWAKYELHNWHLHVGRNNFEGSEHTIDGNPYSGEIHLVFYNTKYGSYKESLNYRDGRAVIAVFIQNRPNSNRPWIDEFLRNLLPLVLIPGPEFRVEIPVKNILPDDSGIYTYSGSSTMPPCEQNVRWIIYAKPIKLSETTLLLARQLLNGRGLPIGLRGNFRPVQRQNGRIVEADFHRFDHR